MQLTANVANQVVNTAYSIVEPHHDAYLAGVQAEQMEIKRIVASTTGVGIDTQSLMRANYNGVYRSYESQGVNPTAQILPTGPMQHITMNATGSLIQWELDDIAAVDRLFRSGEAQVYGPGEINDSNGTRIIGPSYNQLNEQQRFGLAHATYIYGDIDMTSFGIPEAEAARIPGFADPLSFGGTSLGGLVVIDTVNPPGKLGLNDTIIHELQHSADTAIRYVSEKYLEDSSLSASEQEIVSSANRSAKLLEIRSFEEIVANNEYASRFKEVHAYSVNEANHEALVQQLMHGTVPIPEDEARILADDLMNSESIQQIDDDFNAFLDFLETRE